MYSRGRTFKNGEGLDRLVSTSIPQDRQLCREMVTFELGRTGCRPEALVLYRANVARPPRHRNRQFLGMLAHGIRLSLIS